MPELFLFDANLHSFDELSEKQRKVEHKSAKMYDFGLILFDFYLTGRMIMLLLNHEQC